MPVGSGPDQHILNFRPPMIDPRISGGRRSKLLVTRSSMRTSLVVLHPARLPAPTVLLECYASRPADGPLAALYPSRSTRVAKPSSMLRSFCRRVAAGQLVVFLALAASPAGVQQWPNKPITIVKRFLAGAGNGIVLRMYQEVLEKDLGQLEKARAEVAEVLRVIPGTGRQISAFNSRRTTSISPMGWTLRGQANACGFLISRFGPQTARGLSGLKRRSIHQPALARCRSRSSPTAPMSAATSIKPGRSRPRRISFDRNPNGRRRRPSGHGGSSARLASPRARA